MNTAVDSRPAPRRRPVRRRKESRLSGTGAERQNCLDFLDALYIPERLGIASAPRPTLRCKAGNRANVLVVALERAETRARSMRWAKLLFLDTRKDEHWTGFLRSLVAMSALFVVTVLLGLGLQHPAEDRAPSPKTFSMTPTAQGPSRANAPQGSAPAEQAEVLQNDLGQVIEVRASDPGAVLVGFCRTMMIMACDPVELAWSDPPNPRLRLGVYHSEFTKRAIQIRRLPGSRQWVAGDGQRRIENFPASSLRLSGDRLRVRDLR